MPRPELIEEVVTKRRQDVLLKSSAVGSSGRLVDTKRLGLDPGAREVPDARTFSGRSYRRGADLVRLSFLVIGLRARQLPSVTYGARDHEPFKFRS